jgi:nifR3 family TIM-barrel protein
VKEDSRSTFIEKFGTASVCLAPMAGYSDAPFRLLCAEFGADFATTEMVSADGLVRGGARTRRLLERLDGEAPLGVQLFGSNPESIAAAARVAEEAGAAFVDLNFGCPVKKVVRKNGGAALMRDLELMSRICSAVVMSVNLPVTAKIRSGWNSTEENYIEAGEVLEKAGISAVTLHPRYRSQGFGGSADWRHIRNLDEHLSIPVIANGDVRTVNDYEAITAATGSRVVMVGRGALGRPWIFEDIKNLIECRERGDNKPSDTFDKAETGESGSMNRIAVLERHVTMEIGWKGEKRGILEMRKHYRWYLRGLPGVREYRRRLSEAAALDDVLEIIKKMREEPETIWKKPA